MLKTKQKRILIHFVKNIERTKKKKLSLNLFNNFRCVIVNNIYELMSDNNIISSSLITTVVDRIIIHP